ncbi:MAG TPA: SusC/RagA family TonB-linked outer membrane protein [Gemmatimonadaceae bacterium]|nr:SusC/RagA family TonB-linked outer membrane protein [Gemmatimonadaceae bacterium]
MRVGLRLLLASAAALASAGPALAQNSGTIAGRVTERQTQRPLTGAQVRILGGTRGVVTDDSGSFRIVNVPPGTVQLSVQRIGYGPQSRTVTVTAGGTATVEFTLAPSATTLDAVTVTATGQSERKRENGAPTATIDSAAIPKAAVSNLSDALSSRVPGVVVQTAAGEIGAGSRIRIRGSNSISLSNEPLLIVDGIRADNSPQSSAQGTGGQLPSRYNDINPEDIEDIEIIKGPAAAALYGTAAANGVIQITTKKGRAGRTRWDVFGEAGNTKDVNDYPLNLRSYGHTASGALVTNCNLLRRTSGLSNACVGIDSTVSNNPLVSSGIEHVGSRRTGGLSVTGGSDVAAYFVSGDYQHEQGVVAINEQQKLNLRSNIRSQLTRNLDMQLSIGYVNSDLRRPQNDNNSYGVVSGSLLGKAADCSPTGAKLHPGLCLGGGDTVSHGYFNPGIAPTDFFNINTRQIVQRLISSLNSNWTPLNWLAVNATVGADINHRNDNETLPADQLLVDETAQEGYRNVFRAIVSNYTSNLNASATYDYMNMHLVSTVGTQYSDVGFTRTDAQGAKLLSGTGSLAGTTARFAVGETNSDVRTIGFLGRQEVGFGDRLFLTGAVRTDRNSAFGTNFDRVYYPSLSASWVVSDNGAMPGRLPAIPFMSSLRLRAARGSAGQNPGYLAAEQFYNPVAVTVNGTDVPAFTVGGAGNPGLKPEKSTETEGGFDLGLFNDRLNIEYTHYSKTTRDALVNVNLAPSLGTATNRFQNLGRVKNWGDEAVLRADLVNRDSWKLNFLLNGSWSRNRLVDLGLDENGVPIPQFTGGFDDTQIFKPGLPLGAYYQRAITSVNDANKDGLIACPEGPGTSSCEFTVADSASYLGTPFPQAEINFVPQLSLGRFARITATFDHRGGQKIYNLTGVYRNAIFLNGAPVQTPSAGNLQEQAAAQAAANGFNGGFIEDASFTKLREVTVSLFLPQRWAAKARAGSATLTLAGRNLHTWTNYTGLDPELNAGAQANFTTTDFLTQPQIRYFTARLSLGF